VLGFIDHLTNWYVRRSRRRFWAARGESGVGDTDKFSAFATLYEVLTTFSDVVAPVLPFISEHLYQDLIARQDSSSVRSVHHRDYPVADEAMIDSDLESSMSAVREVVRLGRNLRKQVGHRVRQPLAALTVLTPDGRIGDAVAKHAGIIIEELNVKEVNISSDESAHVSLSAKANFRKLGPILGSEMRMFAALVEAMPPASVDTIVKGGSVVIEGRTLGAADVIVERTPREGTLVETGDGFAVALDTRLTAQLVKEGLAREMISYIQKLRRDADLDVIDRIRVSWDSDADLILKTIEEHRERISSETLAIDMVREGDMSAEPLVVDGYSVRLDIEKT
jgi:isoleucyl-tRNA synthetase